ncbi:MAG: ankyrin repeat domain-containing protein [Acidiferrobacterales bacterium]
MIGSLSASLVISLLLAVLIGPYSRQQQPWAPSLVSVQYGGKRLICDDIEQRYAVQQNRLNSRTLNFLLFDAAERGCVKLVEQFLAAGAAITARDRFGNTALLRAARAGENTMVDLLLEKGFDVHHRNLAGSTALLRAVTMNRRRTATILLAAGAEVDAANNRSITPLIAAAYNGNERIVRMLLQAKASADLRDATGKGAIVYAAGKGFSNIVAMLLDAGVDVDALYEHNLTALMWAVGYSNDVPVQEGLETVRVLLGRRARYDLADDRGRTALMIAAERDHAEVVTLLLQAGADRGRRDAEGRTAHDLAASDAVRRALEKEG